MSTATLSIDLDAIRANWRALNEKTSGETGAVVKANAYGLGAGFVAKALLKEGVQTFFVAVAEKKGWLCANPWATPPRSMFLAGICRGTRN